MDEIVKVIQDRTGLDEDQSKELANAILDVVKNKLPENFRPVVDSLISGDQSGIEGAVGGLLGGIFGSK